MEPLVSSVLDLIGRLAWPAVVLLLARRFEPQLRELFARIREGPVGTKFDPAQTQAGARASGIEAGLTTPSAAAALLPGAGAKPEDIPDPVNPVVARAAKAIQEDTKLTAYQNPETRAKLLAIALGAAQTALNFDRIHRFIWASQMAILRHLDRAGTGGETEANVRKYYETAAAKYPALFGAYPFERYIGYLTNANLIEQAGDSFRISDDGREFLKYVITAGLPEPLVG